MAIAYDNSAGQQKIAAGDITQAMTVSGSNRILFAATAGGTGGQLPATSVTYAGVSMTQIQGNVQANVGYVNLWYLVAPSTGSNNAVASFPNNAGWKGLGLVSYTGVAQTNSINTSASGTGTGTSIVGSVTTTVQPTWCVMTTVEYPNSGTASTNSTFRVRFFDNEELWDSSGFGDISAGPFSMTVTNGSSDNFGWIMAAFSAVGAVAPATSGFFALM